MSLGVVRTALLTDNADGTTYDKRGFVYNESFRTSTSKVENYLAGKGGNLLDEMEYRIRSDENLRDSTLEINGQNIHYYVRRGEIATSDIAMPALMTLMTIRCPDDRERWAVWFQREPAATPTAQLDIAGSVGDEKAIKEFLGYLKVCQ